MNVAALSDDELATRLEQKGLSEPTIADLLRRRDEADTMRLIDDFLGGRNWDG